LTENEISKLLRNFDETQLEIMAGIAVRIASVKAERWSGQITFVVNASQGGFGDMQINRGEIMRIGKTRRVRSGGL